MACGCHADSLFHVIVDNAEIKPAVMQIELHPYAQRKYWQDMAKMRALNKEKRFFNMDYKQAEQFVLNWKMDD